MQTVRWGIIGCGDVTEIKSGPALQQAAGSSLVAVMRRTPGLAADYARRHGVPKWYDDAAALIADPDVDAVYIATPPGSHCELAVSVCRQRKPAYVEKPMARNYAECEQMIKAFRDRGQKLFVAYYRRALPRFMKLREIVTSGQLGTISGINYQYRKPAHDAQQTELPWRLVASTAGGGLFFDLGSHALDILDFVFGPLTHVRGMANNIWGAYEVEDNVVMHFRTANGAVGIAAWNFASADREDRLEIIGTQGRVVLSIFGNAPLELHTSAGLELFLLPNPRHIQSPMIQSVVDDLLRKSSCESTGDSAARTSKVMDEVTECYYGSRRSGFWKCPQQWPGNVVRSRTLKR